MFKSLNRGISAPIAIIIIVVCALLVGGIVVWQYLETPDGEEKITEIKPPEGEEEEEEEEEEIQTGKFEIDYNEIAKIQERVDEGSQPFYLTPDLIPWYLGSEYGFDVRDSTWSSRRISGNENDGEIKYEVIYKGKSYVFTVIQPIKGEYKIWIISEIQEK